MDSLLNLPLDEVAKKLNRGGQKRNGKGEAKGAATAARVGRRARGGIRRKKGGAAPGSATAPKNNSTAFVDMTLDSYAKANKVRKTAAKQQIKQTKTVLKTTGKAKRGNQLPARPTRQQLRATKRVNLALTRKQFVQRKAPQQTQQPVQPASRLRRPRGGRRNKMPLLQQQGAQQAAHQAAQRAAQQAAQQSIALQKASFGRVRRRGGRRVKAAAAVPTRTIPVIKNMMKKKQQQRVPPMRQQQRMKQQFGNHGPQWTAQVSQFVQPPRQVRGQQNKRQQAARFPPRVEKLLQQQPQQFSPPPRIQRQSRRLAQRSQHQEQPESTPRFYSQHDTQRWQNDRVEVQAERPSFIRNRDKDTRKPRGQKDQRAGKQTQKAQSYPTVKVSNMPTEYSRTDILGAFKEHFQVHDVIMKNRGTAFVLFTSLDDARMAKEQFDGGEMNDHQIRVSFADAVTV